MGYPNTLAFFMLAIWPLVTVMLFNRLPVQKAVVWSLFGAYLILPPPPAGFDFPLLPPLTKDSLPSVVAFILYMTTVKDRGPLIPENPAAKILVLLFIFSPIATVLGNGEPIWYGEIGVKGLGFKDILALCVLQAMLLLPFLMARQVYRTTEGQKDLIMAMFLGGLVYSLPMLLEVRLAPQLNIWIYGFFQHSFEQMVRSGGFRPIVFLYHGLWVAFLAMTTIVLGIMLWRARKGQAGRIRFLGAAIYMLVVLVLCKSLGSLIYALFLIPMVLFVPLRWQLRVSAGIAVLAVVYPIAKGAGLVPVEWMLEQAAAYEPQRAASLKFRFDSEDILMERALKKPWFGWGSWGRNHILHPLTGSFLTISDGRWIIVIGVYGWVGFLAEFLLIALPLILLSREMKYEHSVETSPYLGGLALLLAINLADMIPNATLTALTWLFVGALLGHAELLRANRTSERRNTSPLKWRPLLQ